VLERARKGANAVTFFPDGQIGLYTYGMTAWFDYVFYVEAAPAPWEKGSLYAFGVKPRSKRVMEGLPGRFRYVR
jgi:hypothetical protein